MTLRTKTLCIVTTSLVAFLLAVLLLFRFTVFDTFRRLEMDVATAQATSTSEQLKNEIETLYTQARLWSAEHEMSLKAGGSTEHLLGALSTELAQRMPSEHRLTALALLNSQGTAHYTQGTFIAADGPHPLLAPALRGRAASAPTHGLTLIDHTNALLLAIHTINDTSGQVAAWMVLGRALREARTTDGFNAQNFSLTLSHGPAPAQTGLGTNTPAATIAPSGFDTITADMHTRDLLTGEALSLRLNMPRTTYARGVLHSVTMSISLVSLGLLFVIVTIWMLNRHVLSRLTASIRHLRSGLHALTLEADIGRTLDTPANDEFGALADAINNLLAALRDELQTSRHHQNQLQQAERLASLGTLVSGVAHEINTPNNYISLNAEMLERRMAHLLPLLDVHVETLDSAMIDHQPYAEVRSDLLQMISAIREGGAAIKKIVEDLKVFSQQDASPVPEPLDVNASLQTCLRMLDADIKAATEHVTLDLDASNPMALGNPHRIEQVFINLIQNACQALEHPSQAIHVCTRALRTSQQVEIVVTDHGRGMSSDVLDRIREPFYTTRRGSRGTGLGLYVTSTIIERHKGELRFESDVGSGTRVIVRLPAATPLVLTTAHEEDNAVSH